MQYAVALGAVALAIALWAVWAARNARRRLRQPWLAALQLSLFGAAAAAWHDAGQTTAAAVLAVVAVVNVLGGIALKQD